MNTSSLYPRFSDAEFARRYALVRTAMQEADLSALVLHGTASSYHEVQYLSNFLVTREAMLVFPDEGEPTLFVQFYNHVPNARRVASITDVRWGGTDIAVATANNLQERGLAQSRIGIMGTIPFKHYETIRQALPHATFLDFTPQMHQLRLVKSDEEIAFLQKGAEFSDRAIEALEREARPGITEHELAPLSKEPTWDWMARPTFTIWLLRLCIIQRCAYLRSTSRIASLRKAMYLLQR
jgi:Xaa-Pro aminopeptidase